MHKPSAIRYIKLGKDNEWEGISIRRNEIHFGYPSVPHELCVSADWEAVRQILIDQGSTPERAQECVLEIRDFYTLGSDCLWFTISDRYLRWAYAEPQVSWLGNTTSGGARMRKTVDGWHNADSNGLPLDIEHLSSRLLSVATTDQTICSINCEEYLVWRLTGDGDVIVAKAMVAQQAVLNVAKEMIERLPQVEYEELVDLIFTTAGWKRLPRIGAIEKDVDLEFVEPIIRLRALACLKSEVSQIDLDNFINNHKSTGLYRQKFFIFRNLAVELSVDCEDAVESGLYDWLIRRCHP